MSDTAKPQDMASVSYPYFAHKADEAEFLTEYTEALRILEGRQSDTALREKVTQYLGGDIPSHFKSDPVLYLARHVATPNFETLRFMSLLEPLGMPIVISQDKKDTFSSANVLKKALGKLPICTRITSKEGRFYEQFENISIIDFNTAQGKPLDSIHTLWGESLIDFHTQLFEVVSPHAPVIVDDSSWIDTHHRGNLLEHYKHFLALFLVHGILFEDYIIEDEEEESFKKNVLVPAFSYIEKEFGIRPLIVQLLPTSVESTQFWLSYPTRVREIIQSKLH